MVWIASILLLIPSLPSLYRRWMAFADWLSIWVTRALFTVIYLLLVPFIWILYMTTGRRAHDARGDTASVWIPKHKHDRTVDDLQRMG